MKPAPLSKLLADPAWPQPPHWRSNEAGRPSALTIAGKGAVAILEASGVAVPTILQVLGLRMSETEFATLRKAPSTDPALHRRALRRAALIREGKSPLEAAFKTAREI